MLMNETRFILLMEMLEIISLYFLTFDFFILFFYIFSNHYMAPCSVSMFVLAYYCTIDIMCFNGCVILTLRLSDTHTKQTLTHEQLSCSFNQSKSFGIFKVRTILIMQLSLRESIQRLYVRR